MILTFLFVNSAFQVLCKSVCSLNLDLKYQVEICIVKTIILLKIAYAKNGALE